MLILDESFFQYEGLVVYGGDILITFKRSSLRAITVEIKSLKHSPFQNNLKLPARTVFS